MVALATVALAMLTYFYLKEVKEQRSLTERSLEEVTKQRSLTEKAISLEHAPKVYLQDIESRVTPDYARNELVVHSTLVFFNCGRTEAANLSFSYVFTQDGKELKRSALNEYDRVYPGQSLRFDLENSRIPVNKESMNHIEQAQQTRDILNVPWGYMSPVTFEMSYSYDDREGRRTSCGDRREYLLGKSWVVPVTKHPASNSSTGDKATAPADLEHTDQGNGE
jgi:hypothetical protein